MRYLAAILCLALSGCGLKAWTHADHIACSKGKVDQKPMVYVTLSTADAICLPPGKEFVEVIVFVQLRNLPAQKVILVVNGQYSFQLYGTEMQLELHKVGLGLHDVQVSVLDYRAEPVVKSWAVYHCGPAPRGELYKSDGTGLKDYCNCPEEKPCTTQE